MTSVFAKQGILLREEDLERIRTYRLNGMCVIEIDNTHVNELFKKYDVRLSRISHPNGVLEVNNAITGNARTFNYNRPAPVVGAVWACVEDPNVELILR